MTTYFNMNIPILEHKFNRPCFGTIPILEHKINRPCFGTNTLYFY